MDDMEYLLEKINNDLRVNCLDYNKILEAKVELEQKLDDILASISNPESDINVQFSKICKETDETGKSLTQISKEVKHLKRDYSQYELKIKKVEDSTLDHIKKINMLENAKAYLKVLNEIEELSVSLETHLNEKGMQPYLEYMELCKWAENLKNTQCLNLLKFVNDTVSHWHAQLKDRLSKDFEEVLNTFKWPFIGANSAAVAGARTVEKFQAVIEQLVKIQLPECIAVSPATAPPIILPVSLLLRPLKKRFIYHFSGNRQTNQSDKPEWYFTQISFSYSTYGKDDSNVVKIEGFNSKLDPTRFLSLHCYLFPSTVFCPVR